MASWWPTQQQQQQQQQAGEAYEYPPGPSGQPGVPGQFFYDAHTIMVDGGSSEEYLMHTGNHASINDGPTTDYHHRRQWFNG